MAEIIVVMIDCFFIIFRTFGRIEDCRKEISIILTAPSPIVMEVKGARDFLFATTYKCKSVIPKVAFAAVTNPCMSRGAHHSYSFVTE